MPLVTNMEGNNSSDADYRRSCFVMTGLLVEVDTKTCRVGPNKEGGVGHVLDYSGDGAFDIKCVLGGQVERKVRYGCVKYSTL